MAPRTITSLIASAVGRKRVHIASIAKTPFARAAATTRSASAAVFVNDFSTSTGLPASMASSACSAWNDCGVAM